MPVFSYTALDPASRRVRGVIQAETPRQARSILLRRGIRTTGLDTLAMTSERSWRTPITTLVGRMIALRQRSQVLDSFENLLTLLESHVPLEEAWDSLAQGSRNKGKSGRTLSVVHALHEGVRMGRPMSAVMEAFGQHFDAVDVALLQAGENSGELAQAVSRFCTRRRMAGHLLSTFAGRWPTPRFCLCSALRSLFF